MSKANKVRFWSLYAVCLLSSGVRAIENCPIERARYELMGDEKFSAGFDIKPTRVNPAGELVIFVSSLASQYTYWFRLNSGNGYSILSMTPLEQPKPGSESILLRDASTTQHELTEFQPIFLIDENLVFFPPESARPGLAAPMYLFPAALAPSLWYHSGSLGNPENTRELMLRALFKYKDCRQS